MTVLGAVVFGGILALGVLWLLVTAPSGDVEWSDGYSAPRQARRSAPGTPALIPVPRR